MAKLSLVAASSACVLGVLATAAAAQPAGFTRAIGFGVDNASTALTDYQVRLTIDTAALIAAGHLRADGADLAFTLGSTCDGAVLPHYVESGLNTPSTIVWVKVPSLGASTNTRLRMWYSNPAAITSTSSARAVFIGTGANNDPISSTNQVAGGSAGGSAMSQRGFQFRPNVPVLAVELGKNEPNGGTRWVTVFDMQTQGIVGQQMVNGPAGSYGYAELMTPFWLAAGQAYTVQLYQGGAGSDGYYLLSGTSQVAADLTYVDMRYCNGCTQDTFPTQTLANYHYGFPDFRYYKRQTSNPEPRQVAVTGGCAQSAVCDADCTERACGDGFVNADAGELCDDGNTADTDGCRANCTPAVCGDGVVNEAVELCDDGNADPADGCQPDCLLTPGFGCCATARSGPRELAGTALLGLLVALALRRRQAMRR